MAQLAQQNRGLQLSDTNGERYLHQISPVRLQQDPIDGIFKQDIDMLVDGLFLRTVEFEVFPVADTRHQLNSKQIGEGKKSGGLSLRIRVNHFRLNSRRIADQGIDQKIPL